MEGTTASTRDAKWEKEQLAEIDHCISAIERIQAAIFRQFTQSDVARASGRRCVLGITGLKYTEYKRFFEVTSNGVRVVPPNETFNTYIAAPVDSVLRVLKGLLNGDSSAFAAEQARGVAVLYGEHKIHDGWVFADVFARLARVMQKYRGVGVR